MKIAIHSPSFNLSAALQAHTIERLRQALAHARHRVRSVTVRLRDLNGPRGGVDKQCGIQVAIDGMGEVVAAERDHDLYAAIARAAERIGRNVERRIARNRPRPVAVHVQD
jgi:ribosomal subunit interface protein